MESEGPASNFRAVAEARAAANRSAMSTLIRARSLRAKEIPVERVRDTRCVRTARRDRGASDLGDLVAFPVKEFMPPARGRGAGGIGGAIRRCRSAQPMRSEKSGVPYERGRAVRAAGAPGWERGGGGGGEKNPLRAEGGRQEGEGGGSGGG